MSFNKILENCYNDCCYFEMKVFDIKSKIQKLSENDCGKLKDMFNQIITYSGKKRWDVIDEYKKANKIDDIAFNKMLKDNHTDFNYGYFKEYPVIYGVIDYYEIDKNNGFDYFPDFATDFLCNTSSNRSFYGLDAISDLIIEKINACEDGADKPHSKKEYKNEIWFKIGLTFANGKAYKLCDKYINDKGHFTKITKKLGFKFTDRPYFSETFGNSSQGNQNIYYSLDKMKKISDYCEENYIPMDDKFTKQLSILQTK